MLRGHEVYTGSGQKVLTSSLLLLLVLLALKVYSRGYKWVREGKDPKSSERSERVLRARALLSHVFVSCSCVFV